jgi:hypothetical protein
LLTTVANGPAHLSNGVGATTKPSRLAASERRPGPAYAAAGLALPRKQPQTLLTEIETSDRTVRQTKHMVETLNRISRVNRSEGVEKAPAPAARPELEGVRRELSMSISGQVRRPLGQRG